MGSNTRIQKFIKSIDWILIGAIIPVVLSGLATMISFEDHNLFFTRQMIWFFVSIIIFFILSVIDFKFLRRTQVITWLFLITIGMLLLLLIFGTVSKGAQSWFNFGAFSFQPAELAKLVLILLLAKYFTRRHIEIKNIRHIIVSGLYAALFCIMVLMQPDLGSAMIIFLIWFGMILVSGISRKHLLIFFILGIVTSILLWSLVLQDYQKDRILTFVHPLEDIQGAGYNAYQSTVTVGSGQLLGKGFGFGSQSRLKFLPEYQTDFIFAAFAEEWGFVGVIIFFFFFGIIIWRILDNALHGATNFEILFGLGLAIMFMAHFIVHVGMNIGLLPVTGITIPFVSYGGTHLLVSFVGLGILMGMRRYSRSAHKDIMKNEFLGI